MPRGREAIVADMVPLGNGMTVPRDVDEALNRLKAASGGLSRVTVVRQALIVGLSALGVLPDDALASLQPTPYERKNQR